MPVNKKSISNHFCYHLSSRATFKHVFIVTENTMFEQDKKTNLKPRAK